MRDDVGFRRLLLAGTIVLAAAGTPAAAHAQDSCSNAAYGGVGPDCRAPERVTPADKNGRAVLEGTPVSVATSGGRVVFRSFGAFAGNESAPYQSTLQGRRDAAGWTVRGIDPLLVDVGLSVSPATVAISDDGTKSLVIAATVLTPDAPEEGTKLYLRDLDDPQRFTLVAATSATISDSAFLIDGTPDFSTVMIQSTAPLQPDGQETFGPIRLYRWSAATGDLALVGLTNTFLPEDPSDDFPFPTWSSAPAFDETRRSVSEDGERLTYERYTGNDDADLAPEVRQDVGGTSRLVSHPDGQPGTPADGSSPIASPDGRTVTFVSADPLTADSVPDGQSVYQETDDGTVVDLLAGLDGRDAPLSGLTLETVSPDGRLVWFRSTAAVIYGNNPEGGLYAFDTVDKTFRAEISLPADQESVRRYSPNGRVAAYTVGQQLFVYDTTPGAYGGSCLTCDGTPTGTVRIDAAAAPQRSTAVLDDGRVFFDAQAQLDPRDENATSDVYQYTPKRVTFGGTTTLLTSGKGRLPALFGGVSPDGQDVFVTTQSQLVPADDDDRTDMYSIRANGGLAAQQVRPVPAEPCRGDACKPPATPVPATPALVGSGSNEPAAPAPPSPPAFSVSTPSKSALRTAARTGTLGLRVRVGAAGTISAGLRGTVRGSTRTIASRTAKVSEAGTTTLRLQLSRAARRKLRRTGALTARLTVAYSERTNRVRKTIRFEGGRR